MAYHHPDCSQHPANAPPESLPVDEVRLVLEALARWTEAALAERDEARTVARQLYQRGDRPPFPSDYYRYPWLKEEEE